MASTAKRSFKSFVKRAPEPDLGHEIPQRQTPENLATSNEGVSAPPQSNQAGAGQGGSPQDRTQVITSTGRVRTYTASRNLPGVTLRLTEDRWERLKLLSIQERRPIQEILGEAVDAYMRNRGLRW